MKVESVHKCIGEDVRIDRNSYRRYGPADWEILLGESWEPCSRCSDLEAAYQEYILFTWHVGFFEAP